MGSRLFLLAAALLGEISAGTITDATTTSFNPRACNAFLMAPRGTQRATHDLLRTGTNEVLRQRRREELRLFINRVPVGSREVLAYLFAFEADSVDAPLTTWSDWAPYLRNSYLMRPGNEALAFENLNRFLEAYWLDFLLGTGKTRGKDRFERGFGWMQKQTLFLIELSEMRPRFVKTAWAHAMSAKLPYVVNLPEVTKTVRQATEFLQDFLSFRDPEVGLESIGKWARLKFIDKLVHDLDWVPDKFDDFITLKHTLVGTLYEENWKGSEVEAISPAQAVVFLFRLARYAGMSSPELDDFTRAVDVLRPLLQIYPRGI